ncbi:hypothetical protein ABE488_00745 [Luteimonas sp. TWI662]|uniref:hypothetical protein n=1 Tax=Luteimonas sp. TWI662 TaxID=3136789 RepID=UPI00320AE3AA
MHAPADPNTDPNSAPSADDVAGLDAAIAGDAAPAENTDAALGESLDRAISEDDTPPADAPVDEPAAVDPPAADPVPGSPEAAAAEAAAAADPNAPPAGDPAVPAPDAEVEAEITALGLKEKSAARFRELTAEVKELAPIREQLTAAGIKDLADLPRVIQRSRDADDLISMVQETGATPEQYGMTLDYLRVVNAAQNGDPQAAERALEMIMSEAQALAQALGREIPGVHDPIAAHQDLVDAVKAGEVDRARALEVANARTQSRALADRQRSQVSEQQTQQVAENARQQLIAYDQQMQADPQYVAKRPMLDALVSQIRQALPPQQWLAATQRAYASIPAPPAPPAPPAAPAVPAASPMRATGPRAPMTPTTFDTVEDALEAALSGR